MLLCFLLYQLLLMVDDIVSLNPLVDIELRREAKSDSAFPISYRRQVRCIPEAAPILAIVQKIDFNIVTVDGVAKLGARKVF